MSKPSEAVVRAWVRLVRAQSLVMGEVESALKSARLPPLEWYDVLLELERAGPLRPRDLQAKLLLAQYNLSRLLQRMLDAGLIERHSCPEDGRGQLFAIGASGRKTRRRMWPAYAAAIQKALGSKLTDEDASTLARILGGVKG